MTEHLHINKIGTSFWNSITTVAADAVEIYNNWGLIQYQISLSSELEVSKRFGGSNSLRPNTTPCGINNQCQHWFKKWLAAWRHQAITWTNADIHVLSIGLLGTNFSQILFAIQEFSTSKMHLKCYLQNDGHFVQVSIHQMHILFWNLAEDRSAVQDAHQIPTHN